MDAAEARVRAPSVVRAWLVAHDARALGAAAVVVTLGLCVGAQWLLPVPGQARKVPFWQLTPALLAMLASLVLVNRLPSGRSWTQGAARAGWACAVIVAAAGSAGTVGLAAPGLPSLVPGTVVVVGFTVAAAAVVGRSSVWVGAVLAVVVLARVTRTAADEDLWHGLPAAVQGVLGALSALGVLGYAVVGARSVRMSDEGGIA